MGLQLEKEDRLIILRKARKSAGKKTSSLTEPGTFERGTIRKTVSALLLEINLAPIYTPFNHSTGKLMPTFIFKRRCARVKGNFANYGGEK